MTESKYLLAQWYNDVQRHTDAGVLLVQVANARTKVLGREHLPTLFSKLKLRESYVGLHQWKQHGAMQKQVVEAVASVGTQDQSKITVLHALSCRNLLGAEAMGEG